LSPANSIGFPFIELLKVESTNNYAMRLIHEGMAQHGTVVFAHEQIKGKGQRNKQWISSPKQNLMFSLIIEPFGLNTTQIFLLSMSVANGVQTFFSKYAADQTKIKWPNDLYWCDRKAGGILIENVIRGNKWKQAVIGIGININQTDFGEFKKAVSLKMITGKTYDTVELAKELLIFLNQSFHSLVNNVYSVVELYHKSLYRLNEKICFKTEQKIKEGLVKGVNNEGQLLIQSDDDEQRFNVGEIEWLSAVI
jgi:BirA family biotin operon repressor/biotin-[acetyl-CoA-carboxylase] ligase